jgi:hypothetical protein
LDKPLFYRVFWSLASGFVGGGIASVTARDAYLSSSWASHRAFVGLVVGALVGTAAGLLFGDFWMGLAGGLGAAVGGLIDALVYGETLEE